MKTLLTFCVILLHLSLISCRTVPHSELDSPNEDIDSPTEEIANLLIPLIEKTLEKNSNKRARKLIQMLPYNESVEASRWSRFNKKRVVEIMPLRRKQRRGEKPLAYLLAAPHSDTERRESRKGRKHETEDIDVQHDIEHEVDDEHDDSDDDGVETKSHDYVQRRGHGNSIQRNHETTEESKEHRDASGSGSQSYSGSSEEDGRVDEPLDYDDHDASGEDAASRYDDNGHRSNQSDDDDLSEEGNSSVREELNDVSENVEGVSEVQERDGKSDNNDDKDDNITEDTGEESNDNDETEENVSLKLNEEDNIELVHKSDEINISDDVSDDSNDDQYWDTKEDSFQGILENNNDSFSNSETANESLEIDSNRNSNCRRLARVRDSNVNEGDRRHEHKSYRLSFLFNR